MHLSVTSRAISSAAFLCAVVLAVTYFNKPPQYALPPHLIDKQAVADIFRRDIRIYGGEKAYERMAVALSGMQDEEQHGYAHQFGHELYKAEGERSIGVCDGRFNLGCFHQFVGDAIADLGTGAVERLYRECGDVFGSVEACQHGLGHGVLSGLGYTEDDLRKALSLCGEVTQTGGYSGCDGGVFMEYNVRTIASAEGIMGARTPETDNLYAPCDRLDAKDRPTCIFWLPQWWFFSILEGQKEPAKRDDLYATMGTRCAASVSAQSCYEGIGYITPTVFNFDGDAMRSACDATGAQGLVYCRSMAALIIRNTPAQKEKAQDMCGGLRGSALGICISYALHEGSFSFSVKGGV